MPLPTSSFLQSREPRKPLASPFALRHSKGPPLPNSSFPQSRESRKPLAPPFALRHSKGPPTPAPHPVIPAEAGI